MKFNNNYPTVLGSSDEMIDHIYRFNLESVERGLLLGSRTVFSGWLGHCRASYRYLETFRLKIGLPSRCGAPMTTSRLFLPRIFFSWLFSGLAPPHLWTTLRDIAQHALTQLALDPQLNHGVYMGLQRLLKPPCPARCHSCHIRRPRRKRHPRLSTLCARRAGFAP